MFGIGPSEFLSFVIGGGILGGIIYIAVRLAIKHQSKS